LSSARARFGMGEHVSNELKNDWQIGKSSVITSPLPAFEASPLVDTVMVRYL
jgi:hypothetical protein